jgi:hypothetical protein
VSTLLYLVVWQIHAPLLGWAISSILLGLGFTFFSGATEAWLVDALAATWAAVSDPGGHARRDPGPRVAVRARSRIPSRSRCDPDGYPASYVVSGTVQALAVPFAILARRENASSDPITENADETVPPAAAAE